MPGRSGPTWWSLQNRGSPRPRSRAKRGGRAPEAPKGGRRVPRRGDTTRPLTQNLRGKMRTSLKIFPRNASCPPRGRGNERFLLSFIGCARSARLPELSVPPPARVRFFALPRYNHRAPRLQKLPFPTRAGAAQSFSAMQSARGTRNKKHSLSATQTFRFNLPAFAFVGVSAKPHCPAR